MENTSKKTTTHRETKPKTLILLVLCLPHSFAIEKRIWFSFLFQKKCNLIGDHRNITHRGILLAELDWKFIFSIVVANNQIYA